MDEPTQELGHLAWCALVALHLAMQDGKASSAMTQHLFLMQWLAAAQKQKRFPRSVATDIAWLLNQGKLYGFGAKLKDKMDYLYRSCTGVLKEQSDLFRLTYAVEVIKSLGWLYSVLSDKAWRKGELPSYTAAGFYLEKMRLDASYSDDGTLITPLDIRFIGNEDALVNVFRECALALHLLRRDENVWYAELRPLESNLHRLNEDKH